MNKTELNLMYNIAVSLRDYMVVTGKTIDDVIKDLEEEKREAEKKQS